MEHPYSLYICDNSIYIISKPGVFNKQSKWKNAQHCKQRRNNVKICQAWKANIVMLLFLFFSCCPKAVSERIAELGWTPPNAPKDFCSRHCFALAKTGLLFVSLCHNALRYPTIHSETFAELSSKTLWHISGPRAICHTIWGWMCVWKVCPPVSNESWFRKAQQPGMVLRCSLSLECTMNIPLLSIEPNWQFSASRGRSLMCLWYAWSIQSWQTNTKNMFQSHSMLPVST